MAFSADRFFENHLTVLAGATRVPVRRLGYESKMHLFDVEICPDGTRRYVIDGRPVETPGPYHRAVLAHFGLEDRP